MSRPLERRSKYCTIAIHARDALAASGELSATGGQYSRQSIRAAQACLQTDRNRRNARRIELLAAE
jgi:hypothetical protein